nr:uncharacterized protein LOC109147742 [Ipomoea batatas]
MYSMDTAAGTSSPGVDVPDASTTSLVLPTEGGLKGVGPDEERARSQGFGGGLLPAIKKSNKFQVFRGSGADTEKPYGPWLRAGQRRGTQLVNQRWVAPASHIDRRNWVAPAKSGDMATDSDLTRNLNTGTDGADQSGGGKELMQVCAPMSNPITKPDSVCVEQKKRRHIEEGEEVLVTTTKRRRFCFDNMWLREDVCREIVEHSWHRTMGLDVLSRIEACGQDVWRWGKNFNKDFQRRIEKCKGRLERRMNKIDRLRNEEGAWVTDAAGVGRIIMDYFGKLFTAEDGDMEEVIGCIKGHFTIGACPTEAAETNKRNGIPNCDYERKAMDKFYLRACSRIMRQRVSREMLVSSTTKHERAW